MTIKVTCSQCQKSLKAPDKLAGKRVRCPSCDEVVQVPELAAPELDDDFFADPVPAPDKGAARAKRNPSSTEPEFDWSQPLEGSSPRNQTDDFDNVDELPSLPAVSRKKVKKSADAEVAYVPAAGIEEPSRSSRRNKTSRVISKSEDTRLGYWHWLLFLAMVPLAISILVPAPSLIERLRTVFNNDDQALADALGRVQSQEQFDDFIAGLPDGRVPGAHLARKTLLHWIYAGVSAGAFLVLIVVMFPGSQVTPGKLVMFGVLTGTVGILLLISFQWVAEFTQTVRVGRVRGIIGLLFLVVKFIGFSYRCATDGQTGFGLSFVGFTCGVGLCEELCKALPVAFYLSSTRDAGWKSACLVGLASGIGFGVSEGIMYSSDYYNGIAPGLTYLVRFVSCVTLHAIWGSSVALLMYNNQDYLPGQGEDFGWDTILSFVTFYLGIAMVLHGLYDTLLKQNLEVAALGIAAVSFGWWTWQLNRQQ